MIGLADYIEVVEQNSAKEPGFIRDMFDDSYSHVVAKQKTIAEMETIIRKTADNSDLYTFRDILHELCRDEIETMKKSCEFTVRRAMEFNRLYTTHKLEEFRQEVSSQHGINVDIDITQFLEKRVVRPIADTE